jgi:flagellar basal body-associated protein FliL
LGIISHKDVFTSKYITAIIRDSSGRGHIRHIKHCIGDYWVTDIDSMTYIFKVDDSRIITYKETAAKSCRILFYSTKHYLPISAEKIKLIEDTLRMNSLPRINITMFGTFKLMSQKEKQNKTKPFENHSIPKMVKTITESDKKFTMQAQNLQQFFENMAIYEIVTPVREITEFIEDDLLATDPKYLGDIYNSIQRTDFQHKKINNAKVDAKKPWVMIIALVAIIAAVGFMGFFLISNGGLNGILPSFPTTQFSNPSTANAPATPGQKIPDSVIFQKYPNPADLQKAIQSGEITMNQLSPKVQDMVKSYKTPQPVTQASTP